MILCILYSNIKIKSSQRISDSFFDKVNLSIITVVDYGFKFSINSNKYEITYINFFLDCGLSVNVYRVEKVYSIYVKPSYINFPFLISLCGLILSFKKCNVLLRFTCDTYLEITYGYSLSSTSTQPQRKDAPFESPNSRACALYHVLFLCGSPYW